MMFFYMFYIGIVKSVEGGEGVYFFYRRCFNLEGLNNKKFLK